MKTPYNTGKVTIGSRYQPPVNVSVSGDMEHLQSALLGHRGPRIDANAKSDADTLTVWQARAISVCLAAVILIILAHK